MKDRGFESDAAYFDIVANQTKNPSHKRRLREVAKAYRLLSKRAPERAILSRREQWQYRAEECRRLSEQFQNSTCRAQLQRLADTYEMLVAHCDPVLE